MPSCAQCAALTWYSARHRRSPAGDIARRPGSGSRKGRVSGGPSSPSWRRRRPTIDAAGTASRASRPGRRSSRTRRSSCRRRGPAAPEHGVVPGVFLGGHGAGLRASGGLPGPPLGRHHHGHVVVERDHLDGARRGSRGPQHPDGRRRTASSGQPVHVPAASAVAGDGIAGAPSTGTTTNAATSRGRPRCGPRCGGGAAASGSP